MPRKNSSMSRTHSEFSTSFSSIKSGHNLIILRTLTKSNMSVIRVTFLSEAPTFSWLAPEFTHRAMDTSHRKHDLPDVHPMLLIYLNGSLQHPIESPILKWSCVTTTICSRTARGHKWWVSAAPKTEFAARGGPEILYLLRHRMNDVIGSVDTNIGTYGTKAPMP